MDKTIKAKWIAALRSGKFKQTTTGFLQFTPSKKKASQYCCLGVLMCVQGTTPRKAMPFVNSSVVPTEFSAGLSVEAQKDLARRNDAGNSFASLANYIEQFI
jgi:hypothetical protein